MGRPHAEFHATDPGGRMLFAMPVAGGSERALNITTPFWNVVPTAHGLYYASMRVGQKPPFENFR